MRTPSGLRARVAAPAVEGKANRALLQFLSSALNVPISAVQLVRGVSSRLKVVEFASLDDVELELRLNQVLGGKGTST